VYLTGATIFTLLSGQRVHMGETIRDQLFAITTKRARSLATAAPDVPMPVVQVVDKALELEMHDRWPSARAMQLALRAAAGAGAGEGSFEESDSLTIQVSSPDTSDAQISTPPTPVMPTPRIEQPLGAGRAPPAAGAPSSDDPTVANPAAAPRFGSTPMPTSGPPLPPGPRPLAPPGAHSGPMPPFASPGYMPPGPRQPFPSPHQIPPSHGAGPPLAPPPQPSPLLVRADGTGSGPHPGFQPPPPPRRGSAGRVLLVMLLLFMGICAAIAVFLARGGRIRLLTGDAPSVTLSARPPLPPSSSAP
jgi:hypothetical protein